MSEDRGPSYVYPVVGVHTGGICQRKEIDEFCKDKRQLTLLTRAFQILSERGKDDTLSYFQIAGIHGSPTDKTWPVQGGPPATIYQGLPGYYCYHFGPLFATWHRPYVSLIEQAIHDIIMKLCDPNDSTYILSGIEADPAELEKWKVAAETWRLPYWDFALRRANNNFNGQNYCSLPDLALADIQTLMSNDNLDLLPSTKNPFFAYDFPGGQSGLPDSNGVAMSIQTRTVRHAPAFNPADPANVEAWRKGNSNIPSLKAFFRNETVNWRANLIDLMINNHSYPGFTAGESQSGDTSSNNLNAVHGSVHVNTGGFRTTNGNMRSVPAAAFDPIFFLWHCNVDRIAAMWEKANPNKWMSDEQDREPLYPFRTSATTPPEYWISHKARDIPSMGYTYPDLDQIKDPQSLENLLDELYSDDVQFPPSSRGPISRNPISRNPISQPISNNPGEDEENELEDEILVTAKYETHEVGPFYIDISCKVGEREEFITSIVNFVTPMEVGCDKCRSAREQHHTATTSALISPRLRELKDAGKLGPLASQLSNNVEQALAENLQWKCYKLEGNTEISQTEFTSLQIGVFRRTGGLLGQPRGQPRGPGEPAPPIRNIPLKSISRGKPFGLGLDENFRGENA